MFRLFRLKIKLKTRLFLDQELTLCAHLFHAEKAIFSFVSKLPEKDGNISFEILNKKILVNAQC